MKHKNSKAMFLHSHPGLERKKDIDKKHIIVDIDDWTKAKRVPEMIEALKTLLECYTYECRIPNVKVVHETQLLLKEIES